MDCGRSWHKTLPGCCLAARALIGWKEPVKPVDVRHRRPQRPGGPAAASGTTDRDSYKNSVLLSPQCFMWQLESEENVLAQNHNLCFFLFFLNVLNCMWKQTGCHPSSNQQVSSTHSIKRRIRSLAAAGVPSTSEHQSSPAASSAAPELWACSFMPTTPRRQCSGDPGANRSHPAASSQNQHVSGLVIWASCRGYRSYIK